MGCTYVASKGWRLGVGGVAGAHIYVLCNGWGKTPNYPLFFGYSKVILNILQQIILRNELLARKIILASNFPKFMSTVFYWFLVLYSAPTEVAQALCLSAEVINRLTVSIYASFLVSRVWHDRIENHSCASPGKGCKSELCLFFWCADWTNGFPADLCVCVQTGSSLTPISWGSVTEA